MTRDGQAPFSPDASGFFSLLLTNCEPHPNMVNSAHDRRDTNRTAHLTCSLLHEKQLTPALNYYGNYSIHFTARSR